MQKATYTHTIRNNIQVVRYNIHVNLGKWNLRMCLLCVNTARLSTQHKP